jgi:hypothetical protein
MSNLDDRLAHCLIAVRAPCPPCPTLVKCDPLIYAQAPEFDPKVPRNRPVHGAKDPRENQSLLGSLRPGLNGVPRRPASRTPWR